MLVHEFIWTVDLLDDDLRASLEAMSPPPPEVDVAWVTLPEAADPSIKLPDVQDVVVPDDKDDKKDDDDKDKDKKDEKKPKPEPKLLAEIKKPLPKIKLPPPPPPEVAKKDPPKPPPPPKKPPPPPPPPPVVKEPPKPKPIPEPKKVEVAKAEPPKPKPPAPPKERKKMIEIQDKKDEQKETNYDANYYSDKNRRPEKETYAKDRNLEKTQKGQQPSASTDQKHSADDQKEVGADTEKNAQLEDTKASSLDAKRKREVASIHDGKEKTAEGIQTGSNGNRGQSGAGGSGGSGGQNGQNGQNGKPGALSMRNVQGMGAPGKDPMKATPGGGDDAPIVALSSEPPGHPGPAGREGAPGKPGKPGKKGPKLTLDQQDYKRIVGTDKEKEETEIAKRSSSHHKGRWEKKLAAINSTLETFTGEVKPGNQTALGTRAHPFALYIARMHNRIHELWGYGFIADLDSKSYGNPMNDRTLETTMEIVINTDGTIDKVTIVKPSGQLTFDVAAVDTVMSAGPYEETPNDIRSSNGKVYVHWTFHRDERLCSPYFADPFILDNLKPGDGKEKKGMPEPGENLAKEKQEKKERGEKRELTRDEDDGSGLVPHLEREQVPDGDPAAAATAAANAPTPDDPAAEKVAGDWAAAFEKDDIATLVAVSDTPFSSRNVTVADDAAGLAGVWRTVMNESEKRHVSEWKLLSAAGYRAVFGALPPGAIDGTPTLFLVAKVDGAYVTMTVVQKGDGSYKINALNR